MSDTEILADGLYFAEGPRWHDGRFWFSDFYAHAVSSIDLTGERRTEVELGDEQPSGLGWLPDGRLLVVAMLGRQVLRLEPDGTLAVHADLADIATHHCNDMIVDVVGRAYVGNMGFDVDAFLAEHGPEGLLDEPRAVPASLAMVDTDGSVRRVANGLGFPNGMVISADGSTLIVAQTVAFELTAFDRRPDATLTNRRVWADLFTDTAMISPDGICLDAEGGVWVADALGTGVHRVTRAAGSPARSARASRRSRARWVDPSAATCWPAPPPPPTPRRRPQRPPPGSSSWRSRCPEPGSRDRPTAHACPASVGHRASRNKGASRVNVRITDSIDYGNLAGLIGTWKGDNGVNLIAVPDQKGDFTLLIAPYTETLTVEAMPATTPNRGLQTIDNLPTLRYTTTIYDTADDPPSLMHAEAGFWELVASSTATEFELFRLASVPHGDAVLAMGGSSVTAGPPAIDTTPSAMPFGNLPVLEGYADPYTGEPVIKGYGPTSPNEWLVEHLAQQEKRGLTVTESVELSISTRNSGGISNIASLTTNANPTQFDATFWIETLEDKDKDKDKDKKVTHQLQYSQTTLIEFPIKSNLPGQTIVWPHVNVNTLTRQAKS